MPEIPLRRPSRSFTHLSMHRASPLLCAVALATGCTSGGHANSGSASAGNTTSTTATSSTGSATTSTASASASSSGNVPPIDAAIPHPCMLPGSVVFTSTGRSVVPGGSPTWPDLGFLTLPAGFCAHYYGTVGNARQIRFAPGGELFVASPSALSTGGNAMGINGNPKAVSAIVVLPDDNLDGVADSTAPFLSFPPGSAPEQGSTNQGMLFAPGFFYYQDGTPPGTKIMRVAYVPGDRTPSANSQQVADLSGLSVHTSSLHFVKSMDMADDGSIYVGNGSDQNEACVDPHAFVGGVYQIDPAPGGPHPNGKPIAQGMRNPAAIRCAKGHNHCFALELAKDYTGPVGGREKLVPIRQGDDWGVPCCAARNLPYAFVADQNDATPSCANVTAESNSFLIGDTPFGIDFEAGLWPAPWTGQAFVVTHGASGTWAGARLVAIPMDPTTGLPKPSTNADAGVEVGMVDFATGWDPAKIDGGSMVNGRPSAVAFASDGRLFVANDYDGIIFWIAPVM